MKERRNANWVQCLRLQNWNRSFGIFEYKFGIEVDELGHNNRSIEYEIQRQKEIEKLTWVCVY